MVGNMLLVATQQPPDLINFIMSSLFLLNFIPSLFGTSFRAVFKVIIFLCFSGNIKAILFFVPTIINLFRFCGTL